MLAESSGVRESVTAATLAFDARRSRAYDEIDIEAWREWAAAVRSHALAHLDRYLEEAEDNLIANGARVHWARDAEEARTVLDGLVDETGASSVVKAKSMLSEELRLADHLERRGVRVSETDLGEYVIQLFDEQPSHIVGPAIHRSLDECRTLFHELFGTRPDAAPDELAAEARLRLRKDFLGADIGITGGNFVAADTGTVALIENEGNIRLCTSLPKTHVAFVGIDKVTAKSSDLAGLLQLTARAATGQTVGNYVSFVQGPRKGDEPDGPEELHVVFVDNGRTRALADPRAWEALRCVRCGACLNSCPVYRQTGGHAYGWVYSGPIGAVLAPSMLGLKQAMPLPFASTLCGACGDVCPVRIPIPELLRYWRARAADEGLVPIGQRWAVRAWAHLAERPHLFRRMEAAIGKVPFEKGVVRGAAKALPVLGRWLAERELPSEPAGRAGGWSHEGGAHGRRPIGPASSPGQGAKEDPA